MKTVEFGKQHNDVIMLLHGGGLSWWNYKAEAELPTVNKSQNAAPRYNGNMHQIRMQEKIENYSATQKVASMQISRMRFIFPHIK